jgi:hypothetical protein
MRVLRVGQTVAYSSAFIRSVQWHEMASLRGEVVEVFTSGKVLVCRVRWQHDGKISAALASNLVAVDRMHLEAA